MFRANCSQHIAFGGLYPVATFFLLISPSFCPACTLCMCTQHTETRMFELLNGLFAPAGRCFQHNNPGSTPGVQLTEESVQQSSGTFSYHSSDRHVRPGGCGFEAQPGHSKELDLKRGSMHTRPSLRRIGWIKRTDFASFGM